jgi:hypothetical protein
VNRTTIRIASAVLSVIVTFATLSGVGIVADQQSAATSSESRLARRAPAPAPVQVAAAAQVGVKR